MFVYFRARAPARNRRASLAGARARKKWRSFMMMGVVLGFVGLFRRDVPTAIVARWGFVVTGIAQQRSALEILFEPRLVVHREIAGIAGQRQVVAAAVALPLVPVGQQRGIVIVGPAADLAGPVAQGTGRVHLGRDRLADELALVGQLVEEVRQLGLDLERYHFRFLRLLRHTHSRSLTA